MNNSVFENLSHYLKQSSKEELNAVWEATQIYDNINSPTVDSFIENANCFYALNLDPPEIENTSFVNIIESPKFTSDFLFNETSWTKLAFH